MVTNEKLDPNKEYEWFVVESRHGERNGHTFHKLKCACVTEDVRINEEFFLEDRKGCEALAIRIAQISGGRKDGVDQLNFFKRGEKFYAKVQPELKSDGTVIWSFNPFSFARSVSKSPAQHDDTHEKVIEVIKQHKSRKDILDQLNQLGQVYVREFRRMEGAGEVKV